MNKQEIFYHSLPCGEKIPPTTIHAVSASFPTMNDIIGYEEKKSEIMNKVKSGYPRFVTHHYVKKVTEFVAKYKDLDFEFIPIDSIYSFEQLKKTISYEDLIIEQIDGIFFIKIKDDLGLVEKINSFLQHTGCIISSRQAEDFLFSKGLIDSKQKEEIQEKHSSEIIKRSLANFYQKNIIEEHDVYLYPNGMNAIFNSFLMIQELQKAKNKTRWIQFGWLYVDNMKILEKYSNDPIIFYDIHDLDGLESVLKQHGSEIAGIITEVPTNPLIETTDLVRLKKICEKWEIVLLADISVSSSATLDVSKHVDIIVESLTKFASGSGDLMMGALFLVKTSKFYNNFSRLINLYENLPYIRDVDRLGFSIQGFSDKMIIIQKNANVLVDYFQKNSKIKKIYWAYESKNEEYYKVLERKDGNIGGVITLDFDFPIHLIYDHLNLLKGPSFGMDVTLNMPYVYLAHYDMIIDETKLVTLQKNRISPNLLRVSIGLEDPEFIINEFELAFKNID